MIRYSFRQLVTLVLSDFGAVIAALFISSFLRVHLELGTAGPDSVFQTPPSLYLVAPLLWILALHLAQVYSLRHNLSIQIEIANLVLGHVGATLLFWGLLYIGFRDYSRLQSLYVVAFTFLLLLLRRLLSRGIFSFFASRVHESCRVLIVGTDETAQRLAQAITYSRSYRLRLIGFVGQSDTLNAVDLSQEGLLGSIQNLPALVQEHAITDIVISLQWFDQEATLLIQKILTLVESYGVSVRVAPNYSDVAYFHTSSEAFAGIPLIGIREPIFTHSEWLIKRTVDILFSASALILCLPLFILIAVAIRLDSPGPVLLRQERIGYRGRPFMMYKFRSMFHSPDGKPQAGPTYNLVKLKDDPRITRVGKFLRRTSLDELPQFFNVLIGDMSLVGPRPEIPSMVERYEWWQRKRFEVPQGMTGWWQVNGRADKPMYFHTSDDLYYIRNYSIWLDFRILIRTGVAVIFGRGAY